jgi:hypothetical protein
MIYDVNMMRFRVDEAVNAMNSLVLYANAVLSGDSRMKAAIEWADMIVNNVQDHLADTPNPEWVGAQDPSVPCFQCAENYAVSPAQAKWLAPRVVAFPTPDHPERPWTYQFVPICDECSSDWWGVCDADRPAFAPPFMALPIGWVGV